MKISVCIPVYNFDVTETVQNLRKEISENNLNAEIILIDDCSEKQYQNTTQNLQNIADKIIFLEKNVGRSKIRNSFLRYASGTFLLFLDCDAKIIHQQFIRNYISEISKNPETDLFYGGFNIDVRFSETLRNLYSLRREISKDFGSKDFSLLKTANFIIKKVVLAKIPFDENLCDYGYEDYVFAKKLEKHNFRFLYINNPVIHYDQSENSVFLSKTKRGINSLHKLSLNSENSEYINDIKLFKAAKFIKKIHFTSLYQLFYKSLESKILKNLLSKKPNLYNFDLYKLHLLLEKL